MALDSTRAYAAFGRRWLRTGAMLTVVGVGLALGLGLAVSQTTPPELPKTVDLNSSPNTVLEEVPNIALALSVEFPTVGAAYRGATYDSGTTYLGYWDPTGCYTYKETSDTSAANLLGEYYVRSGTVSGTGNNATCGGSAYSGNLLNYVASSAIDILRLGLTGGHRAIDTATRTVLERAYLYNGWALNQGYFPVRQIPIGLVGKVMPSDPNPLSGATYVFAGSCKDKLWFGRQTANNLNCDNPAVSTTTNETSTQTVAYPNAGTCLWAASGGKWYCTSNSGNSSCSKNTTRVKLGGVNRDVYTCNKEYTTTVTTPVTTTVYYGDLNPGRDANNIPQPMYARVKVCEGSEAISRTDLCQRYPSGNYKPVGQIQIKSDGAKVSVFGYLAENGNTRNGGVLRAPMDFLGPTKLSNTGTTTANPNKEWDLSTGVFATNPRNASGYTYSGAINYINRFGTTGTAGYYKSNDPVGELYYEALRYFMGLGPTADAVATPMSDDGYPVYSTWTDPITSSCQRKNYILTIGDVNTHYDKRLPGHRTSAVDSVNESTTDTSRAVESLKGSSNLTFDAPRWAKVISDLETGATATFTNSLNASVGTSGNPNPNADNSGLNNKVTGSQSSAYYWAGAAYWANTQAIRYDNDADGKSKNKVRVKTFTIDVDEGGNGLIDGNTRTSANGRAPRSSSFYLAGKYGWFENTDGAGQVLQPVRNAAGTMVDLDGQPFRNILTGANDNSRWQDPAIPNTPNGYVIASQAQKLLDGIKKFFATTKDTASTPTVTALSSLRFSSNSPDGDTFLPQFSAKTWTGALLKARVRFNTATGLIEVQSTTWDAGKILTDASVASNPASPMIAPANRKIFTFSRDAGKEGGQAFTVQNKGNLDATVLAALQTKPSTAPSSLSASGMADANINWIRGDRTNESNGTNTSGYLRLRSSILGDIINSGTVYKKEADSQVTGPGYGTFAATQKSRTAVVYVGSNDGMLHAFAAADGKELFAYIPRAVAPYINQLADPYYVHRPYVDAVPFVGEAQVSNGETASWKTLLVSGMGGGAQGIFALDVTDPDNFGASKAMFEFTDEDDADMGNVVSPPRLVKIRMAGTGAPQYKWFVAVSSGYNNYQPDGHASSDGTQALFLLSVDKPASEAWALGSNYYKMKVATPAADKTKTAALANPGFAQGINGDAIIFYAGDTQGNLWKFDLQSGLSADNASTALMRSGNQPIPMAILADSTGKARPITTAPLVAPGLSDGFMVIVGTGKFIERADSSDTTTQAIYGIWDNLSNTASDYQVGTSKLFQRTLDQTTGLLGGAATFPYGSGTGTGANKTYRGWYFELPTSGERVSVDGDNKYGYSAINSMIPPPDCNVIGTSRTLTADNIYGSSVGAAVMVTSGYLGRPNIVLLDDSEGTYTYTARSAVGRRDLVIKSAPVSSTSEATPRVIQGSTVAMKVPAGRVGWREIKDFEE